MTPLSRLPAIGCLLGAVLSAVLSPPTARAQEASDHHHRFEDPHVWDDRFEDPARDGWQLPDSVLAVLLLRDDLVVGDIGSATGYFPVRFARALPRGFVIGSDVEPGMVTYLNDRARKEGITNLVSVLATADDPHFPRAVDVAFVCNTIHHIEARVVYFTKLREQIATGGRLAVVDYRPESSRGPRHKLDPAIVERELIEAGWRVEARHDFLPEQYFLVFGISP